jgi:hypothetical protein
LRIKRMPNFFINKFNFILIIILKNNEFTALNRLISRKYVDNELKIYTPTSKKPLLFKRNLEEYFVDDWVKTNICRAASQILVGVEVLELIFIIEAMAATDWVDV